MNFKRFVAMLLVMIAAVCTGVMSLTVSAASAVWSIEVPGYIVSTDQIVLPKGWEFTETTALSEYGIVTVTAVNAEKDSSADVIITRLSDDTSVNDKDESYGRMNETLLPQLKKSADGSDVSDSSSATGANDSDMQALPNAADDDGLPITGASAGLASIAAVLLAVAFVIGKNSK